MFGAFEFYKKCNKNNIKPIVGLEINLADGNHIICDSKVSLDNWKKFVMATEDQEKEVTEKNRLF